jgi:hypothetical protein
MATDTLFLTEAAIQKGITDLLKQLGFDTFHNRYAIGSDPGFPDIVGVSDDGMMVAIECKGPKGRLRFGQSRWIDRFDKVPGCIFAEVVGPTVSFQWVLYDEALVVIQERVAAMRGTG